MKKNVLLSAWGGMFLICAGLGFLPQPQGVGKGLLIALAVLFFLPGALLLRQSRRIRLVRNLSLLSLGLTVGLLVLNVLGIAAPKAVGTVLHILLGIVSAPMFCGQIWVISLLGWSCLLLSSLHLLKKR